uniref:Uncharacterized protein n=1 Tax=Rhizophora mucronata TaxID=61149 RepID=A0A2P2P0A3_RHIMU
MVHSFCPLLIVRILTQCGEMDGN